MTIVPQLPEQRRLRRRVNLIVVLLLQLPVLLPWQLDKALPVELGELLWLCQ